MTKMIKEIIKEYLIANGFDGLCQDLAECGCSVDDLFPCGSEGVEECRPGWRCSCECGDGHDWHITTVKKEGDHE